MVRLAWSSALARSRQHDAVHARQHLLLWVCLLYRWSFSVCEATGLQVTHAAKMWTVLSSPKCHKVGRLQLSFREARYSVCFTAEAADTGVDLASFVALCGVLRVCSAGFDHGLLRLRSITVRLQCAVQAFEAFMCLLWSWQQ